MDDDQKDPVIKPARKPRTKKVLEEGLTPDVKESPVKKARAKKAKPVDLLDLDLAAIDGGVLHETTPEHTALMADAIKERYEKRGQPTQYSYNEAEIGGLKPAYVSIDEWPVEEHGKVTVTDISKADVTRLIITGQAIDMTGVPPEALPSIIEGFVKSVADAYIAEPLTPEDDGNLFEEELVKAATEAEPVVEVPHEEPRRIVLSNLERTQKGRLRRKGIDTEGWDGPHISAKYKEVFYSER